MKIIPLVVALLFLACVLPAASAGNTGTGTVKVISADGTDITADNSEPGGSSSGPHPSADTNSSGESNTGFESIEDDDFIRNEISEGNKLFVSGLLTGLYDDLENNPMNEGDDQGGVLFSVITAVPNPYEDRTIIELYGGYLNLTLYAIVIFVLGELMSRSIARTKIASGALKHKDLSGYRFMGGIAVCGFALIANVFYMCALAVIEALNEFITVPIIPNLAVNPENLLTLLFMGLCDLALVSFFIIRFYVIYAVAVLCSVIAVMLVPEATRGFATDCIEKIIRLLMLQPAALFVTSVGIVAVNDLPGPLQKLWYLGLTVLVFLTCWYFMFGKFTLLKTAVVFAIRKGVAHV